MNVDKLIRAEVRNLRAYQVAEANGFIKLDAMENPYVWPDELVVEWLQTLRGAAINRYPDPQAHGLKVALRKYLGLASDTPLLIGNGSDEIIQIICTAIARPGATILAPEPSFVMYRQCAEILGIQFVGIPLLESNFALNVEAFVQAIHAHQPAVVFLAYPNNPTGNLFDRDAVLEIVTASDGLIVMDEAYFPFALETNIDLLARNENVLVMQTLSKLGLAGLRIGLLAGADAWLQEFDKVRMPYNVSVLSQLTAEFILNHTDVLAGQTARLREARADLHARLNKLAGVTAWPSHANFLLFNTTADASLVHERLRENGVLVKNLSGAHPLVNDCLRVTVSTPEENTVFIDALQSSLTKL